MESQFGPPRYRYDKCFKGSIINDESTIIPVEVEFHTRPLGLELEYDWDFLWQLLKQKNVVRHITPNFFAIKAKYLSLIIKTLLMVILLFRNVIQLCYRNILKK